MKRVVFFGAVLGTTAVSVVASLVIVATLVWLVRQWGPAPWVIWGAGLGLIGSVAGGIWRWWRLPAERRFRFGLRGMLVGITVFAMWMGVV